MNFVSIAAYRRYPAGAWSFYILGATERGDTAFDAMTTIFNLHPQRT